MHYSVYLSFSYETKLFFISKKHYTKLNSFSVYLAFNTFLFIFLSVLLEAGVLLQETSLLHSILKCLLGASSTELFFQPDSYMVLNILVMVKIREVVMPNSCYKQYKH